jgi:hypothetical protein
MVRTLWLDALILSAGVTGIIFLLSQVLSALIWT